jgi:DNA alkylation repair enzyme
MAHEFTAAEFEERLQAMRPPDAKGSDDYRGVGMGRIFALAKECMDMPPAEIERLLDSPVHAVRVGAVSIMDFQARAKNVSPDRKRELYELYLRRHDRIDTWDLVDRSAIWVVGEYLVDKPRDVLDRLAASSQPMERRTAILATFAFIRRDELDDAYRIAESLVDDPEDTIHKAVGWMLREAGKRDPARQAAFLEAHAATMPRVMLRYTIEKLDKPTREHWLAMKGGSVP